MEEGMYIFVSPPVAGAVVCQTRVLHTWELVGFVLLL